MHGERTKRMELHINVDHPLWYDSAFKCVLELYRYVVIEYPTKPDYIVPIID